MTRQEANRSMPHHDATDEEDLGFTMPLTRPYAAREGAPVLTHVAPRIFTLTYYQPCMECNFCHDQCCSYGVALDLPNKARIEAHAAGIQPLATGGQKSWFKSEVVDDPDFPGARALDTRVVGRGCAFLQPGGRGCSIHRYCIEQGMDYHDLKPIYCSLFPITVDGGYLVPSCEVDEKSLACVDHGATLYQGSRPELLYYFGEEFIAELDALEKRALAGEVSTAGPPGAPPPRPVLPVLPAS
jgi:Fe-S-cluster containining protein